MDNQGNKVFFAAESSSFIERFFLKANRSFTINLLDNSGQKIADFTRSAQEMAFDDRPVSIKIFRKISKVFFAIF